MSADPPLGPASASAPLLSDAANAEHDRPAGTAAGAAKRYEDATRLLSRRRTAVADGERLPAATASDPGTDDGAVATGRRKAAHGEV